MRGVPLDADHEYAGSFGDLLNPYALLGGVATLLLFAAHGAIFLSLRTRGDLRERAPPLGRGRSLPAVVVGGAGLHRLDARPLGRGRRRSTAVAVVGGVAPRSP